MTRYVIIGAGIAGTTAAEEIRKRDEEGEIILIGEEEHALYSRVLLPHYIKGRVPREKCFLKKDTWYEEQKIEYLRGEVVRRVDTTNRHVELAVSGRELPYDKLLITTGGQPRSLEGDVRGVSYLQTIDDADHLLQLLGELEEDARVGVCGGGFIACEYLNIFRHFKRHTTCFYRGPWFWSRVLDRESGGLIEQTLRDGGVTLFPETTVEGLLGERELEGVETSGGRHDLSLLGVGVGLRRDPDALQVSGIELSTGIQTNAFLETNLEQVYAAGDICAFEDIVTGRRLLGGNWMNALSQGRTVGKTMTGERTEFRLVSGYATQVFDLQVIFVGDTRRDPADEIIVRGSAEAGYVVQLFLENNRLVGATLVGGNTDRMTLTKCIDQQRDVSALKPRLSDKDFDLKEIL